MAAQAWSGVVILPVSGQRAAEASVRGIERIASGINEYYLFFGPPERLSRARMVCIHRVNQNSIVVLDRLNSEGNPDDAECVLAL